MKRNPEDYMRDALMAEKVETEMCLKAAEEPFITVVRNVKKEDGEEIVVTILEVKTRTIENYRLPIMGKGMAEIALDEVPNFLIRDLAYGEMAEEKATCVMKEFNKRRKNNEKYAIKEMPPETWYDIKQKMKEVFVRMDIEEVMKKTEKKGMTLVDVASLRTELRGLTADEMCSWYKLNKKKDETDTDAI